MEGSEKFMNCFRSRKKNKTHITVLVDCNSYEFKRISDVIRKAVREYNRSSDNKMSFNVIKDIESDSVSGRYAKKEFMFSNKTIL